MAGLMGGMFVNMSIFTTTNIRKFIVIKNTRCGMCESLAETPQGNKKVNVFEPEPAIIENQ